MSEQKSPAIHIVADQSPRLHWSPAKRGALQQAVMAAVLQHATANGHDAGKDPLVVHLEVTTVKDLAASVFSGNAS